MRGPLRFPSEKSNISIGKAHDGQAGFHVLGPEGLGQAGPDMKSPWKPCFQTPGENHTVILFQPNRYSGLFQRDPFRSCPSTRSVRHDAGIELLDRNRGSRLFQLLLDLVGFFL